MELCMLADVRQCLDLSEFISAATKIYFASKNSAVHTFDYNDVIMDAMTYTCTKSPAPLLFTHIFVQAQIKEKGKDVCHWPLWGESTGDRWIPLTKGQLRENCSFWWRHHDLTETGSHVDYFVVPDCTNTSSAANDKNVVYVTTFPYQC